MTRKWSEIKRMVGAPERTPPEKNVQAAAALLLREGWALIPPLGAAVPVPPDASAATRHRRFHITYHWEENGKCGSDGQDWPCNTNE